MNKYGFFGGSFNPPTFAHLEIAKIVLEKLKLDKVFFVPVGNNYNKPELADEKSRYEMLKIMCKEEKSISVEDLELNRNENLRAYQALDLINKKYNNSENYFIMGADNFIRLPNWEKSEDMLKKYNFIVIERGNINIKNEINSNEWLKKYKTHINVLTLKDNNNCSAGIVRELIKEKKYKEADKYTSKDIIDIWSIIKK